MSKLSLKTRQRPMLKTIVVSLSATAAAFLIVFGIMFIINTTAPTEDVHASGAVPSGGLTQLAMDFNGKTSYVDLGQPNLGFSNRMSVTAWVKWDTMPSKGNSWANMVTYAANSGSGDNGIFWMQHNSDNSKFEFALQTTNGRTFVFSTTKPQQGRWYHVAGVYDGSFIYMYVNGIMEARVSHSGNVNSVASNFRLNIGQWPSNGNNYRRFNGNIDEVSIWKKALSATEIKNMMCKGVSPTTGQLRAYYNFDDNSSPSTVKDLTNFHVNGNVVSSYWVASGAPVGNENAHYYSTPPSHFSFIHPNGDSIVICDFSAAPQGLQVYYVDGVDNSTMIGNTSDLLLDNRTFGVFLTSSQNITFRLTYFYNNNPVADQYAPADLVFASRPASDTIWTSMHATADINNKSLSFWPLTNRTEIALGTKGSPLPISLVSFDGKKTGNTVQLKWVTASEQNNDYFTLEKSADAKNWVQFARIKGAGNSNTSLTYFATDNDPYDGVVYYRLTQTDFDGKFETFMPIKVTFDESLEGVELETAGPNPFYETINMSFVSQEQHYITISLINMQGKIVYIKEGELMEGSTNFVLGGLSGLAQGSYVLAVKCSNTLLYSSIFLKK